ncbi:MAG: hypothetical protein KC931_10255 [Candidatus Omnitrophica bacterium]|nr:hypothetical protein [Candidatus Omnitrophota bacterium]
MVSPLGIGTEAIRKALFEDASGIAEISLFETGDYPVRFGAEVKDFQAKQHVRNRKALKVSRRNIHLALAAGNLAWEEAKLEGQVDPERAGVVMSAGRLGATLEEVCYAVRNSLDPAGQLLLEKYAENSAKLMPPYWFLRHIPNLVPGTVAIELGLKAPSNTICLNGVGSLVSIQEAVAIIERGEADVMLAGGADCLVDPYHVVTHHQLGRLDLNHPDGPRPFTKEACGTVLGETGTVIVLERADFARSRGSKPIAKWRGGHIGRPKAFNPEMREWEGETTIPRLTVLSGAGSSDIDSREFELADPDSNLTCYRHRTGWLGGSNGVHDLACALLDPSPRMDELLESIHPSFAPDRWAADPLLPGDILAVQSISWSGLFAGVRFEIS